MWVFFLFSVFLKYLKNGFGEGGERSSGIFIETL